MTDICSVGPTIVSYIHVYSFLSYIFGGVAQWCVRQQPILGLADGTMKGIAPSEARESAEVYDGSVVNVFCCWNGSFKSKEAFLFSCLRRKSMLLGGLGGDVFHGFS